MPRGGVRPGAGRPKRSFSPSEINRLRERIKATALVNRLRDHAMAERPVMDSSQVQSARILLNKVLPDLQSVEVSGNADRPLVAEIRQVIVEPEHSDS